MNFAKESILPKHFIASDISSTTTGKWLVLFCIGLDREEIFHILKYELQFFQL